MFYAVLKLYNDLEDGLVRKEYFGDAHESLCDFKGILRNYY